jgi:hypothetical protein
MIYRDKYRDLVFLEDGKTVPPLACGQLLIEYGKVGKSRLLIPHTHTLLPRLAPTITLSTLGIGEEQTGVLFFEANEIRKLILNKDQIVRLSRRMVR